LGWGLSLALLGLYLMSFYATLAEQQETLEQLLASYPPELVAFFGDFNAIFTPEGYLSVEFFSFMPLVLGIFAVLAGSGLLASDEENGTLDLVLAHPVSRAALFWGRLLALIAAMLSILLVMWLGLVVGMRSSTLDIPAGRLALPFLSLLGVLVFFGALGLLLSLVLPSRRMAGMVSGLALLASYFITSLARISEELETAAKFSPLSYYQSGEAILGLNGRWLAGLLALALLFTLFAWWRFERRDIRVAGEGSLWGWRLPVLRRKVAA
jgi:ABC-2 type transport system permease protein